MSETNPDDVSAMSYEEALAQLDLLVQKLEGGSIALDAAIAAYERGTRLARHCAELLDRTERRVHALVVGGDGRMTERPLDVAEATDASQARAGEATESRKPAPVDPNDVPF